MIQQFQPEEDDLSADRIAAEISASRHRIDAKLATLAESLSPQHLLTTASEKIAARSPDEVVDGVGRYYGKARRFVRKRPFGSAIIAVGIAAMIFESLREKEKRRQDERSRPIRPTQPKPEVGYQI